MIKLELTDNEFATIRAAMSGWRVLMEAEGMSFPTAYDPPQTAIYQEVVEIIAKLELYEMERSSHA